MKIEMKEVRNLDVWLGHPSEDQREVIIDAGDPEQPYFETQGMGRGDVRITDHKVGVVKVRFDKEGKIQDVLVNDIFVWPRGMKK